MDSLLLPSPYFGGASRRRPRHQWRVGYLVSSAFFLFPFERGTARGGGTLPKPLILAAAGTAGRAAEVRYRESQQYFKPLFQRLKQRSLHPEMVAGLKLMVEAIKERNYLHAYKVGGCA